MYIYMFSITKIKKTVLNSHRSGSSNVLVPLR